jgi:hypothetical protein
MLPANKDKKLSQLFQLKKNLERPNREFWERFDTQLKQKFLQQIPKCSLRTKWHEITQKYKTYIRSFTYATVACSALSLCIIQVKSSKIVVPESSNTQWMAADIIPIQKQWTDVTLAFNNKNLQHAHYICDHIHTSGLNSHVKELVF